ncbi:MAG: oligoendopeptidase F [Ignavibacteriales bacterium]|nr:oligoendopeptidase F [Ignavibacteriales bacterium]MCB9219722.1 oligoendopeptidase F [Ignavibacteriales bacterium]
MISKNYVKNLKVRSIFIVTAIISLAMFNSPTAQSGGDLPKRQDIPVEYTWNLVDIYKTSDLWEADFKWVDGAKSKYESFKGNLSKSSKDLLNCLSFDDEVSIKISQLYLYASLGRDLDLGVAENQARYERIAALASDISAASSFIRPELLSMPEEKLWDFVNNEDGLKVYKHQIDDLLRTKTHTLTPNEEEIMALSSPVRQIPYSVFGMFNNADIQFPTVKDEKGNDFKISHGRYGASMYSTDRDFRERVYKGTYVPYQDYKNTLTALFNGNIKTAVFNAKARKYESTRDAALNPNNIPLEVYDNLVNTVNENLQPLQRWGELKKKILKLDNLHPYDTYVTLFPSVKKEYNYDQSKEILLEALKPLGEDYLNSLNLAFNNRWIDVHETKGKRSGAYSSGVSYGVHPYVLLNWTDQLNDVFTFAHEMGHNMHSYYTEKNQPYPYANYSIFVAEVASTANEALLLDYLIANAETKEEKLALIEKQLTGIQTTFYRQTRFAEFEQLVHEKTEAGEALTSESLCKYFGDMYQKYWGPEMNVDEEESYSWARIPHFYYDFYVYQYATSYAASQELVAQIKKEGQPAIDRFLSFLKAGSSQYPIDVLKTAGVDMTSPKPILAVVNKMNELLDQMEELLAE